MVAAVIPVKHLSQAKSRLSPALSPEGRRQVCLEVLLHMLDVLTRCPLLDQVRVATPDVELPRLLARRFPQVRVVWETGDLNQAARRSAEELEAGGFGTMLFLPGDLPLLTEEDVAAALRVGREAPLLLLPDRHGRGTNGLVLTPPACLPAFCFGPDSLARHREAARRLGLSWCELTRPGFAWDLDTPEDLAGLPGAPR